MNADELYELLGHKDITRDLDVKTLVLDIVRERMSDDQIMTLFWEHLELLDERYIRDYFYRRNY